MKLWIRKSLLIMLAVATIMPILASMIAAEEMAMPVKKLRLPMEYYESGAVKTQLKAGFALVPPKGIIVASNVVMHMFFEDGSTNVMMTADNCKYNREKQSATSDGKIKIVRDNIVITGKGFEWYSERERVKIISDAKIVLIHKDGSSQGSFIKEFRRKNDKNE